MIRFNLDAMHLIQWCFILYANDNFAYLSEFFAANCLISEKKTP